MMQHQQLLQSFSYIVKVRRLMLVSSMVLWFCSSMCEGKDDVIVSIALLETSPTRAVVPIM